MQQPRYVSKTYGVLNIMTGGQSRPKAGVIRQWKFGSWSTPRYTFQLSRCASALNGVIINSCVVSLMVALNRLRLRLTDHTLRVVVRRAGSQTRRTETKCYMNHKCMMFVISVHCVRAAWACRRMWLPTDQRRGALQWHAAHDHRLVHVGW